MAEQVTGAEGESNSPILVTRSSLPDLDDFVREITPLWDSRWLTNRGAKVRELEERLADYLGIDNGVLFANGHLALEALLEAMDLTGEVITTPFTFVSTTHAIVRRGLTPVFADIKPDDFTLDPARIEELITPNTSAIMPVHVYGNICDVDAIADIADRHGLKVIYDAAHAFGVRRDGVGAASYGDASMLSFHATKVYNSLEGGLAVVKDPALVERLQQLQNFGQTGPESVGAVAGNSKMNEFAAAMGLCNLRIIDGEIAKRARMEQRYRERLAAVPGIELVSIPENLTQNHAYLPVRIDGDLFGADRDAVFDALASQNIFSRKYFYPLISDLDCYSGRFDSSATPVAQRAASRALTLPMYADLAEEDVDRVCDVLLTARSDA